MKKKKTILFLVIVIMVFLLCFIGYKLINKDSTASNKTSTSNKTTTKVVTTTNNIKTYNYTLDKNNEFNNIDDGTNNNYQQTYIININNIKLNNNTYTFKFINSNERNIYLNNNKVISFAKDETIFKSVKVLDNKLLVYGLQQVDSPVYYSIINSEGKKVYEFSGSYKMEDNDTLKIIDQKWNSNNTIKSITTEVIDVLKDKVSVVSTDTIKVDCETDIDNENCMGM